MNLLGSKELVVDTAARDVSVLGPLYADLVVIPPTSISNDLGTVESLTFLRHKLSKSQDITIDYKRLKARYIIKLVSTRFAALLIIAIVAWLFVRVPDKKINTDRIIYIFVACAVASIGMIWFACYSWKNLILRYFALWNSGVKDADILAHFNQAHRDSVNNVRDVKHTLYAVLFAGVLNRALSSPRFDWLQHWGQKGSATTIALHAVESLGPGDTALDQPKIAR